MCAPHYTKGTLFGQLSKPSSIGHGGMIMLGAPTSVFSSIQEQQHSPFLLPRGRDAIKFFDIRGAFL
jgi:hypothetical protein